MGYVDLTVRLKVERSFRREFGEPLGYLDFTTRSDGLVHVRDLYSRAWMLFDVTGKRIRCISLGQPKRAAS